ncbi:hypothetical protein KY386_03750 [Candidatus Parcubacteria bacterium]|nr:hypothetical protein [Candidatus Parcubacteria bacterium]
MQFKALFAAPNCAGNNVLPDLYRNLRGANCEVVFDSLNDVGFLLANVIQILLAVAALVAVAMIIFGGITYITSSGDPSKVTKAKDIILNTAVWGLGIVLMAYALVAFISESFS